MSAQLDRISTITLFVDDLERSRSFYQGVFGRPLIFQDAESAVFQFENILVNLLATAAARDLVEPATVGAANAGSRFVITVPVDDVDATCAELAGRGIALINGPVDREWGLRTASFADPDGTNWEVAQDLPAAGS